ncbi:hypothetical protein [Desulfonema magnum]|uniref:hypothetical protein n=1 Tax=Desulfonema magnum TaxID=45655 RepID=UPI001A9B7B7B|nr:hypothetical protein [Desulfonema magnum]
MKLRAFVAKKRPVPLFTHLKKSATKPQSHKGTAKRLRETSCLRVFVAKKRVGPAFYPKKSAAKRLRETLCLRAFVAKKTDFQNVFSW